MSAIPDIFCDSETGQPYAACLVCGCNLTDGRTYMTEKAFRRYTDGHTVEVFGYALCMGCVAELQQSLSDESRRNMQRYMEKCSALQRRAQGLFTSDETDDQTELWKRCTVNGTLPEEEDEYMVCAMVSGGKLEQGIFPYMLGGRALDHIMQQMSDHTLGFLDDFTGKHFSGPPECSQWLRSRPVFV